MTTAVATLTDFLLARIAEDEAMAQTMAQMMGGNLDRLRGIASPKRTLAECEAKRRIVESRPAIAVPLPEVHEEVKRQREYVLRLLALPYADDPDYRQEWAV